MTRPAVLTYMSTASDASRRHRTPAGRPTLAPSFPLVVKNLQKLNMETEYMSCLRMKVTLCIIGTEVWVYGDFFFYRKQRCFWQLVNVLALVHRHLPGLVFSFLAPFWDFPCAKNKLRKHIYAHAIFGISFDKMSESVKVLKRLEAGCKIDFPSLLHN